MTDTDTCSLLLSVCDWPCRATILLSFQKYSWKTAAATNPTWSLGSTIFLSMSLNDMKLMKSPTWNSWPCRNTDQAQQDFRRRGHKLRKTGVWKSGSPIAGNKWWLSKIHQNYTIGTIAQIPPSKNNRPSSIYIKNCELWSCWMQPMPQKR